MWTLCALPALRSRKSSTAKAGVCETCLQNDDDDDDDNDDGNVDDCACSEG